MAAQNELSTRFLIGESWQSLRQTLRPALAPGLRFVVTLRVLLLLAVGPLSVFVVDALVRLSGQPAVTNTGLVRFFLSPVGIACAAVYVVVALITYITETAGLFLVVLQARRRVPIRVRSVFRTCLVAMPRLMWIGLMAVGLTVLALLPLVLFGGLTNWLLLSGHDINYYLTQRPPVFYVAATIGGFLMLAAALILLAFAVRWLFAVPCSLFQEQRGRKALNGSAEIGRGWYRHLASFLLLWTGLRLLAGVALVAGLDWIGETVLSSPSANDGSISLWPVAVVVTVFVIVFVTLSLIDVLVFNLILAAWYERFHEAKLGPLTTPLLDAKGVEAGEMTSDRWRLAGVALLLMTVAGAVIADIAALVSDVGEDRAIAITAHRAGAFHAPENTLAALRQAIADHADFAEIDVQETADGVVIVIHDTDRKRVAGVDRNIWQIDSAELEEFDVGSWFDPKFKGERIPTLARVIEAARGRIRLNIELKYNGHDQRLAERTVQLIQSCDAIDRVVISSLNRVGLETVRRLEPRLKIGYIVAASVGDVTRLDIDFLSVHSSFLTSRLRHDARQRGLEIHVWTVNDRGAMIQALVAGADNLITDDPALARKVVQWYQGLNCLERVLLYLRMWLAS